MVGVSVVGGEIFGLAGDGMLLDRSLRGLAGCLG